MSVSPGKLICWEYNTKKEIWSIDQPGSFMILSHEKVILTPDKTHFFMATPEKLIMCELNTGDRIKEFRVNLGYSIDMELRFIEEYPDGYPPYSHF